MFARVISNTALNWPARNRVDSGTVLPSMSYFLLNVDIDIIFFIADNKYIIRCVIRVHGDAIWFLFQIISVFLLFLMNIKIFYEMYKSNHYGL